jgi:sugar phosphate isomerase/epimerase
MLPVAGRPTEMVAAPLALDRLCVHQVSLMQCDFRQSIECLTRHGITKTAIWKDRLDEIGTSQGARILDDNGIEVLSLCAGGFLTGRTKTDRQKALDNNQRWLDQAAKIGAKSMVTITGGLEEGDVDIDAARDRALEALSHLVPLAIAADVKLALEPLHPMVCGFRSVISTLGEANTMLDALDCGDGLGIALDTYGLWWEPNLKAEISRAGSRIINFHVSDWLMQTSDIRTDRGMPGDGHIDNRGIRQELERTGFEGPVELEIFSKDNWWQRDPDEYLKIIKQRAVRYL